MGGIKLEMKTDYDESDDTVTGGRSGIKLAGEVGEQDSEVVCGTPRKYPR